MKMPRSRDRGTIAGRATIAEPIERFQAKWEPVRAKKTRQNKNPKAPFRFDRNGAFERF
jgi:hypothetical protein